MKHKHDYHQTKIDEMKSKGYSLTIRTIPFKEGNIYILSVKEIIDLDAVSKQIVKPILLYLEKDEEIDAKKIMNSIIFTYDSELSDDDKKIEEKILDGMVLILISNDQNYVISNIKKVEIRSIPAPEITYTLRGPRDCFVENYDVNLSLIRYRLKDPNLQIDNFTVGIRSKTVVAVIYLKDVANKESVQIIEERIKQINVDSIWGTGELQAFLQNDNHDLFPLMGTTERSDMACEAIIDGKIVIIADGGSMCLVAPHTFSDSLNACDDRYDNKFFGLFSKILRYMALFITLCLSSLYIAIISYHTDVLPASFAISLAQMRKSVLFSALIEVLIIEFIAELIRESLIRVPSKIGTAIGIVGAIVIGQAATSAGLFSPLVLIIAASTLMASFAIPDYFAAHPIRLLKILVIVMTGIFGLYGFILAITLIFINLVSINSFGVPYMAPFAPYNHYDFVTRFIFNRAINRKRQKFLKTQDDTRSNTKSENE